MSTTPLDRVQNEPSETSTPSSKSIPDSSCVAPPERQSTSMRDPTSKLESSCHGARLNTVAVPADVIHRNTPHPQPPPKRKHMNIPVAPKKLVDLPPELLVSIFELLVGDPTRYSSVDYRLSKPDTPTPHFSHSWSLECVSRVSRQCRATAWPLLMGTLSVVQPDDIAAIARLPQQHRSLIQDLCITFDAIETLYGRLCALLGLQTNNTQRFKDDGLQKLRRSGVNDATIFEEGGTLYADGTFLGGLSLARLTIFTMDSSYIVLGNKHVYRDPKRFFNTSIGRLLADNASTLKQVVIRCPRTVWVKPATLPLDTTLPALHMPRLYQLTHQTSHPIPGLANIELPALTSITCGETEVDGDAVRELLAKDLRSLRTRRLMPHYPVTLRTLHILPLAGVDSREFLQLARAVRSLRGLYDLRICLAMPAESESIVLASTVELLEATSSTLCILELQEPGGPMNGRSLIADAFTSSMSQPQASSHPNLITPLQHLTQLEVFSLVLQEELQGAPCTTKPPLHKNLIHVAESNKPWRHAWHKDCATFLIERLPSLREVHFQCAEDPAEIRSGTLEGERTAARYRELECVWGRPTRKRVVDGDGDEVKRETPRWMCVGTRTRLWESAMC